MKNLSTIFFALVCIITIGSCSGDAKKMLLGDTDKRGYTPKEAIEALYNTLPNGDINKLKEAVKFDENDKLSDYQKDEFFKNLKNKNIKVEAKKAKERDGFVKVKCVMTAPDGTRQEKKFRLVKEDDIWKTEIGFKDLQDAIYK